MSNSRSNGETEIAGNSFLDLIEYMRTIILQDAAVLMAKPEYNQHSTFQHPIFQSTLFKIPY